MKAPSKRYLQMIKCRAYGHAWEDRGWMPYVKASVRLWEQLLTCPRCTGERQDFRTWGTLQLDSRYYDLPADYPGKVRQAEALQILVEHDAEEVVA